MPKDSHPWMVFLHARARCLRWLRDEGKTDVEIARTMSMDPAQVQMILRHVDEHPEEFQ
jgi:DNA-binding CsgD family transcriptional regulator